MSRRLIIISALLVSALLFGTQPAASAEFPDRPITLVVGFGAGGMTDVCSRLFADKMESFLGQKVIVENKPGAGGYKALKRVVTGPPDGYTLVSCSTSTAASSRLLGRELDEGRIGLLGSFMTQERVLFARKDSPYKTFEGFRKYAADNPVTFAGGGSLWANKVIEAMAKEMGLQVRIVPFRGGAEGSAAILGGHVSLAETGVGSGAWQSALKGGLNVLATLTDGDLEALGFAGTKSIRDHGVTHYVRNYYGIGLPAGVPEEKREKLEAAFKFAVEHPDTAEKMKELNLVPRYISAADYRPIVDAAPEEATVLADYLKN